MIKISKDFLEELSIKAQQSERKRLIYMYHNEAQDPIQRMLNVMEPETYSRPHRHLTPVKREAFILLQGTVAILEFDNKGKIAEFAILSGKKGNYGAEITPGAWHSLVCLESGSVLYEVKDGPYIEEDDKVFASWSPEEYSSEALVYLESLKKQIS